MAEMRQKLHILCERDVGLFSLVQQSISHIPLALDLQRTPVAVFGKNCCYWTSGGYMGAENVWEYYFEPLIEGFDSASVGDEILNHVNNKPPHFESDGYFYTNDIFVTSHFGDHKSYRQRTLRIPYKWKDPSRLIRLEASQIIRTYVRPRSYILSRVNGFYKQYLQENYVIGVHMRATDVTDVDEHNIHRRGSYQFRRYIEEIERIICAHPEAKIFVATDSQSALVDIEDIFGSRVIHSSSIFHNSHGDSVSGLGPSGHVIPGYLAQDAKSAAENGKEAIIDYLLLSECQYLIHNGSGLARTALLRSPDLLHTNTHTPVRYIRYILDFRNREFLFLIRALGVNGLNFLRKRAKRFIGRT